MTAPTVLYGISNCDTIRKAKSWLNESGIEFGFHDYRKQGISANLVNSLAQELGWEAMLNRRGTTWKKLDDETRENIDSASAISLMLEQPAMIKRPILRHQGQTYLGFTEAQYGEIFQK